MSKVFVRSHRDPHRSPTGRRPDPLKPADEALYRGVKVLLIFLVAGTVFGIGLAQGLGRPAIGWQIGTRFASLGIAGGLAAAWSRWIAPAGTCALLSLTRRDVGACIGFLAALLALGSLEKEVLTSPRRASGSSLPARLPINISGPTVEGDEFRSSDVRGQVLLIDFWSTECDPCLRELPNILALYDAYHGDGLEVVGISLDENRESLKQFLRQNPSPWPQVHFEGAGWHSPLAERYDVQSIPRIMVVDREGNLSTDNVRRDNMEAAVLSALGREAPNRHAIQDRTKTAWGAIAAAFLKLRTWLLISFLQPPWIVTTVCAVSGAALVCSGDLLFRKGKPSSGN